MELELRHLRAVCAIADTGSLSRASAALGMSQPAVTAQLGRIERDLGGPLFIRDHTGARLTPLGSFVVNRARTVLTGMEQLTNEAARYSRDGHPARVRLGGTTAQPCLKLADLIATMLPETDIQLHTEYSPRLLAGHVLRGVQRPGIHRQRAVPYRGRGLAARHGGRAPRDLPVPGDVHRLR